MKLFSPEGRGAPIKIAMNPRPASLYGLRIGLLDNTKAPVDRIMAHLDARLRERFKGVSTYYVSKAKTSIPAGERIMADLKARCDVLITALGD